MSVIGHTTRTARAIVEVLRPLMGDPSTGAMTIAASGGDVTMPKGTYLLPVYRSDTGAVQLDRASILRTTDDVVVTASGASAPIASITAGARQNWDGGTEVRLDPPLEGLDPTGTIDALGMAGGADAIGVASVRSIIEYETISGTNSEQDLFAAANHGRVPAIIVSWDSSPEAEHVNHGAISQGDSWSIFVVVARGDGSSPRRNEARDIMDAICGYMGGRQSVGGMCFSADAVEIDGRTRVATTPSSHIYAVQILTTAAFERIRPSGANALGEHTYAEWLRTRIDVPTADVPPYPMVAGCGVDMPGGAFGDGFAEELD